uniref:Uncharacterized protein n=1 Tax=Strigamia maritima TaxID=126957 RepID=T1J6U5_STRMM
MFNNEIYPQRRIKRTAKRYDNARYDNPRYDNARYDNPRYDNTRYGNTYDNTRYDNTYDNTRYGNTRYSDILRNIVGKEEQDDDPDFGNEYPAYLDDLQKQILLQQLNDWFQKLAQDMHPSMIADVATEPRRITLTLVPIGQRHMCAFAFHFKPDGDEEEKIYDLPQDLSRFVCDSDYEFKSKIVEYNKINFIRVPELDKPMRVGPVEKLVFYAKGYEDVLLKRLCFSLGKDVVAKQKSEIVCLDYMFFLMCKTLGHKEFAHAMEDNNRVIKFRQEFGRVQGFIIREFKSFLTAFDECMIKPEIRHLGKMCHRIEWRQSSVEACPKRTTGCPNAEPISPANWNLTSLVDINASRSKTMSSWLALFVMQCIMVEHALIDVTSSDC